MTNVKDMTRGSPLSLILTFAFPLMIGYVFQQFYTVVDTMVVGKALGVDALAALGATDWLYWLVLGMIQGITQGFGILMAREFGAKQFQGLRKAVGGSLVLSCFCAGLPCGTARRAPLAFGITVFALWAAFWAGCRCFWPTGPGFLPMMWSVSFRRCRAGSPRIIRWRTRCT